MGRISSVLMLPVYTHYLNPADYGVLELINMSLFLAAILGGMGLAGDALYYFYARTASDTERSQLIYTLLGGSIALSLALGSMMLAGSAVLSRMLTAHHINRLSN
jgi:O-antigen/teichoic acid export membrane protein